MLKNTHILRSILKYLNDNKVLRAKLLSQNVLKRPILTDSTTNVFYCKKRSERWRDSNVLNSVVFPLRSKLFNFKFINTPLIFLLNSYSTEIFSQNKLCSAEKKRQKFFNANVSA